MELILFQIVRLRHMFGIKAEVHLSSVKLSTTSKTLFWEKHNIYAC